MSRDRTCIRCTRPLGNAIGEVLHELARAHCTSPSCPWCKACYLDHIKPRSS